MFTHILLPTDGSELSAAAMRQGVHFARSIGAKVTGLCVVPLMHTFFYETKIPKTTLEQTDRSLKRLAEEWLAALQEEAADAGVACETLYAQHDSPCEEIIRVAEARGCDLIMMASHGRRGVKAFLLGSETQKVLTHSKVPVLVYR